MFKGSPGGATPYAPLLYSDGALYGTTLRGGAHDAGTVFTITRAGNERVLHNFGGKLDGSEPYAGLVAIDGTLYGTTSAGGAYANLGTVFSITPSGKERVLHSFGQQRDGARPLAALTAFDGVLYGTTASGGAYGDGTVFSITAPGRERVLYSFGASSDDGQDPTSSLVVLNNVLYGVTYSGGSSAYGDCDEAYGCGTVFSVNRSGKEGIVYRFLGPFKDDGAYPYGGLIALNGVLYGTTTLGGQPDFGTAFAVTTSGAETILHAFIDKDVDGANPFDALTEADGDLYGTTETGGATGYGTVFKLTTSGQEQVIYAFRDRRDGKSPYAPLSNVDGLLYGTTSAGGKAGAGVIFRILP